MTHPTSELRISSVNAMFESFKKLVEEDRLLQKEIAEVAHEMDYWALKIVSILQKTHSFLDEEEEQLKQVQKIMNDEIQKHLVKLAALIYPVSYYRIQNATLITLMKYEVNFPHSSMNAQVKVDPAAGFHLDIEDYLFGVLQLASELSRFSVNAVVAGNNLIPFKISEFLHDLDANFRLLNLKNDGLRRRYDTLKYDIQRAEQVVYDLTIRGLKPSDEDVPCSNV